MRPYAPAAGYACEAQIEVRRHDVISSLIAKAFDGFAILQISDLHVEMSEAAMTRLAVMLPDIDYPVRSHWWLPGFGPYEAALKGMARICLALKGPIYGVLDTIRMVPGLEDIGVQMLLNENHAIERDNQCIYLAGIDDAHYYRVDNIEKAATGIPFETFSILLSHTPEVYQQASYADFSLLLCGHTHGGQICLPGRIPITLDSVLPRHMGAGPWKYRDMIGYTSVGAGSSIVPVRFNCPPEITLHRLCPAR
jgi:predicted MPP superfamily phosphohydrolase